MMTAREMKTTTEADAQGDSLSAAALLTGGMAHEINNALVSLVTHLSILGDLLGPLTAHAAGARTESADVRDELSAAQDAAQHIAAVVRDVQGLLRADRRAVLIDVRAAVERALRLARPHAEGAAVLRAELGEVPRIWASEASLTQVALNLLLNAIEACRAGAPRSGQVGVHLYRDAGTVVLEIRDDGIGMERELVDRIFEPMVTTKRSKSSGLGLAITCRLVAGMGGAIDVESMPESGTTFRVRLPVGRDLP